MAKPKPKATGDCLTCPFKKAMMNKVKGKKLPREIGGKCTRPNGICEDMKKGTSSQAPQTTAPDSPKPGNEVALSLIYPNPDQPRKVFNQEKLEELAQSIREQGLIEPLVVTPILMSPGKTIIVGTEEERDLWNCLYARQKELSDIPLASLTEGEASILAAAASKFPSFNPLSMTENRCLTGCKGSGVSEVSKPCFTKDHSTLKNMSFGSGPSTAPERSSTFSLPASDICVSNVKRQTKRLDISVLTSPMNVELLGRQGKMPTSGFTGKAWMKQLKERSVEAPEQSGIEGANSAFPQNPLVASPAPGAKRKTHVFELTFTKQTRLSELLSIEQVGQFKLDLDALISESLKAAFLIIAGERRWRACQIAGLTAAPVRIICATDDQIAEMALVENIQRQDLTPLEEAKAFKDMLDKGYTREALAQRLGFKQVWRVDERLSLLNLSSKFQDALIYGVISPSQAFEISRLEDQGQQEVVFQKVKAGELPTYNHLRRFVNAMVDAKQERFLFAVPKKEDLETVSRWEKVLDAVTGLVVKSFSTDDCRVLAKVMNGNSAVNIQKIDIIIKHLDLIKKALIDNKCRQEVIGAMEGEDETMPPLQTNETFG